jgi:hypothetical protein
MRFYGIAEPSPICGCRGNARPRNGICPSGGARHGRQRQLIAIGFDLPDDRSAGSAGATASPVGRVLAGLQAEIERREAAARHLLAIRFDVGAVRVALRERPLAADYPSLATVFRHIARTCTLHRVGTGQLRCILFDEDEIKLMLINSRGQTETYVFPLRPAGAA